MGKKLVHEDEVFKIIGAVIEVHRRLGLGFLEFVYQEQIISYLKATGLRLGLLLNFGSQGKLEWRRLII